jgi:hypothetical protein
MISFFELARGVAFEATYKYRGFGMSRHTFVLEMSSRRRVKGD